MPHPNTETTTPKLVIKPGHTFFDNDGELVNITRYKLCTNNIGGYFTYYGVYCTGPNSANNLEHAFYEGEVSRGFK